VKAIYDILISLVSVVVAPVILFRALIKDRSYMGLLGMGVMLQPNASGRRPIWIHASSVGEVKAALLLVEKVHEGRPDAVIVLTVFTPRGMSVARSEAMRGVEIRYCPLDVRSFAGRALRDIDPAVFVLTETELWLNLLTEVHAHRIPTVVANGRLSEKSFARYLALRPLIAPVVERFAYVHAQSSADAERFIALGVPRGRVHAGGNVKTHGMIANLSKFNRNAALESLGLELDSKVIVCGSTRPGEETMILDAFLSARKHHPSAQLVIAPRHLDRLGEIESLVSSHDLACSRKTELAASNGHPDVILLNTFGELWRTYGIGACAFVGGSLVPLGGHNPLEPIALGVPTCFGPHMDNCTELASACVRTGFARTVKDARDIADFFVGCLNGQIQVPDRGQLNALLGSDVDDIANAILAFWERSRVGNA
jgi:3-deoxy-D-manno-octulosonic-acid transferase